MKIYIIIPAFNEEAHIAKTLDSLQEQNLTASKILVVNDSSTDNTPAILESYAEKYVNISFITKTSKATHEPGSKIVAAFNFGLKSLDDNYDIICKFDADLIFPSTYLEELVRAFQKSKKTGMAGGFCYIKNDKDWVLENLTNKDHIRGALKAYTKECFEKIGGLKSAMGWDTVDEIIAKYNGFDIVTIDHLKVKHLKPTGDQYQKKAGLKQGKAFYRMRYGKVLTQIAAVKLSLKKKNMAYFFDCMRGYKQAQKNEASFLLTEEEGKFLRNLRKEGIRKKIF